MKDIYLEVAELAEKVNELGAGTVGEDGMSILIGVADCKEKKILSLGASGVEIGILEMMRKVAMHIYEEDEDYEPERLDENVC